MIPLSSAAVWNWRRPDRTSLSNVVIIVTYFVLIFQSQVFFAAVGQAEETEVGEKLEEILPAHSSADDSVNVVVSYDGIAQLPVDKQADSENEPASSSASGIVTPFPVELQTRNELSDSQTVSSAGHADDSHSSWWSPTVEPTSHEGNDDRGGEHGGESHPEGSDDNGSSDTISISPEDHDLLQMFYDRSNTNTRSTSAVVL